jgi:hypothetical protein
MGNSYYVFDGQMPIKAEVQRMSVFKGNLIFTKHFDTPFFCRFIFSEKQAAYRWIRTLLERPFCPGKKYVTKSITARNKGRLKTGIFITE